MTTGERIIDRIIAGTLCTAKCAHDDEHGCVIVWSSGAAEQLEAVAQAGLISRAARSERGKPQK